MLIRSQDKEILADINGYAICVVGGEIRLTNKAKSYLALGTYSSREKALNVLDALGAMYGDCEVFQMPDDKEVSVTETERDLAEALNTVENYKRMLFGS